MSFSAPVRVARALERLDLENRRRGADDDRGDLLDLAHNTRADAELLGVPDLIAVALSRTGEIHLARGEVNDALTALDQALAALGDLREQDLRVRMLALRAECLARLGDWPAVDRTCGDGIAIVEKYRYRVSSTYLRSGYLRSRIALYSLGVRAAAETGDIVAMIERAELSKCRGLVGGPSGQSGDLDGLDRDDLCDRFHSLNARIEKGRQRGDVPSKLLAERQLLWDLIAIATNRQHGGEDVGIFDLGRIQASLAAHQAVIYYYWLDRHRLLCLVLDRDHVASEIKTITPDERDALDAFAHDILAFEFGTAMSRIDGVQDFAEMLWPANKAATEILENCDRLIVSPHQVLHAIPFAALDIGGDYLIKRYAIRLAPNLMSLLLQSPRGDGDSALLALGIETYAIPGKAWPPLPDAELEVSDLETLYGEAGVAATALRGADASERALNAMSADGRLRAARRLHIACHGMNIDADTPMESSLCLATSELDGIEISLLDLGADLVVMSACCSGQRSIGGRGMDELPGDELFGLQAAFFAAGVKEIVASLWPVHSETSRKIGVGLHRHLLDGLPSDVALQRAVCDYLAGAKRLRQKRFYWAPFQLTATGRSLDRPARDEGE